MTPVQYPSLFQINTRVWLTERSRDLGRPATLDDMPEAELDRVAGMGCGVYLVRLPGSLPSSR